MESCKSLLGMSKGEIVEYRKRKKIDLAAKPQLKGLLNSGSVFDGNEENNVQSPVFSRSNVTVTLRPAEAQSSQDTAYVTASTDLAGPNSVEINYGTLNFSNGENMDFTESTRLSQLNIGHNTDLNDFELLECTVHLEQLLKCFNNLSQYQKHNFMQKVKGNILMDDFFIQYFKYKGT
ncbi:unnamed protein product [Bursaphelenchus okinawaensis]|uniref:Uncharacterized protein n=1 Tax=Bursaphelenchus okinawaensis TaxID=465554 RepID=A0A811KSU7_9BILA|nr:unnamed protein product [Bursaphelenchus okinawaensis]CAG9111336.1 unnamed protein product [Bursaphelenchus okinawaensis]